MVKYLRKKKKNKKCAVCHDAKITSIYTSFHSLPVVNPCPLCCKKETVDEAASPAKIDLGITRRCSVGEV